MVCPAMRWDTAGNTVSVDLQKAPAFTMSNYTLEWGGGGWHATLYGSKLVLVVSTEPLDDLSCLTTQGSAALEMGCCPCRSPSASICTLHVHAGFADSSTDLCALVCASQRSFS